MDKKSLEEAVRAARNTCCSVPCDHRCCLLPSALLHLREENERYRRALEEIRDLKLIPGGALFAQQTEEIARQALKGEV